MFRIFSMGRILPIILPCALAVACEIAVTTGVIPSRLLPAPSEVFTTLVEISRHDLAQHIGISLARLIAGFVCGTALGILVGVFVGLSRHAELAIDPTFQALRAIPSLAWVPLLLLWLGIDELPKVTMITIGTFFPIYLSTIAGIRDVDRKLVEVGKVQGLGKFEIARRILLPAAMPSLFTGLRTGLSLAWMFLVAAELIAASKGIGYLLSDGREVGRPDIVVAAIVLLGVLGKVSDSLLKLVERRTLAWRDTFFRHTENDLL
jgi:sulfonate transport system permease protein